jgi:DNA (cytosine-5)-methyltransferase 1
MSDTRRPSFTFIDLFAGIGGFHHGLASIGGECVFASEIDEDAASVYEATFGIRPAGDIREIDEHSVPDHDVLCAGFPCQAFSKAGYQQGLKDETRGTLFFDIARILEAKRPRFIMLENVRNLAQHDHGRTWHVIIDRLHEIGYRVSSQPIIFSPHLLPPHLNGAPQFRERVFILGEHQDYSSRPGFLDWGLHVENAPVDSWNPQQWNLKRWLLSHPADEDVSEYRLRSEESRWIEAWGDLAARIGDRPPGFPLWEQEFKQEPDLEGFPKWKQDFHRKNSMFYRQYQPIIDDWRRSWSIECFPNSRRKFEWQAQDARRGNAKDIFELLIQLRPSGIRVKRATYVPALVAITQTSVIGWEQRKITPREAASLQGLPSTSPLHPNPATAYKQLGNAVNVGVVEFMAENLFAYAGFWEGLRLRVAGDIPTQIPLSVMDEKVAAASD